VTKDEGKGHQVTTFIKGPGEMLPIPDLKRQMIGRRRALFAQVAETAADLEALGTNVEPEVVEEGQEENLARLLTGLDDRGRSEIAAIDRALARIASGDYGRCLSCGEPIPPARLAAVPSAEECLPCTKKHELPR
jgi:RNA polymerase-binding transcription factor DksA